MTVLEIIEQIIREKRIKRVIPAIAHYMEIYHLSGMSWAAMAEEIDRLEDAGIIHTGPTKDGKYVEIYEI